MTRLRLGACLLLSVGSLFISSVGHAADAVKNRPNILFISVDDMSCDSVGVFGCKLPDTTPNMDRLARQGLRFNYAHVCVGNCMPGRNVMFSGRYPHNNRVEGFYQVQQPGYPHLVDLMKAGGYFTAIRGKTNHTTPYTPYAWDLVLDTIDGQKQHNKDIQSYYESTKLGIAASRRAAKPFCLLVNISDPHKPFYAMGRQGKIVADPHKPSRVFTAEEVPIPGFLFDDPDVRLELAHYYSSVRRADDCLGAVMKALEESGAADNTFITFLSDHGMPLPFAKTALFHHSTHTPWIVRWPGVTKPDTVDDHHMISAVDLLPTLLDVAGIEHPAGLDGRSILPLVNGEKRSDWDMVFKEYNENSGGGRHPMRGVQTKRFGYLFNPWSDGQRVFRTATTGTMTYRKMKQLAVTDPVIAARLEVFDHRVLEEFYDYENDPDALRNLIDDPSYQAEIQRHRDALEAWMIRTGDHALQSFQHRDNPAVRQAYMKRSEDESAVRQQAKRKARAKAAAAAARTNRQAGARRRPSQRLIKVETPAVVRAEQAVTLVINHQLPADIGAQSIHVTMKDQAGKRIERQVVRARGTGQLEVTFNARPQNRHQAVRFAVFVGNDFASKLQYVTIKPIAITGG